jgi:cobalt-precorrin 5A hydrolase
MGLGEAVTVAGIGCRRGVGADEVLAAVAAAREAFAVEALDGLATLAGKRHEAGIRAASGRLGLPLLVVTAGDAALLTESRASRAATGAGSASEAAALAAAGTGSRLLGPRVAVGRVTCAIAVGAGA